MWKMSYLDYIRNFYTDREDEEMDEEEIAIIYAEHTERIAEWANKLKLKQNQDSHLYRNCCQDLQFR